MLTSCRPLRWVQQAHRRNRGNPIEIPAELARFRLPYGVQERLQWFAVPDFGSGTQHHLDRFAFIHRSVGIGDLFERQGFIEHPAGIDFLVPRELDELR